MSWMQTFSGGKFDFDNLAANTIDIRDIGRALSKICRFFGHSKEFYSVAQHSVLVSRLCPTKPLAGLLHDAAEAYVGDMVRPIKHRDEMRYYCEVEMAVAALIARRFGLQTSDFECDEVKVADYTLLATEQRDLMNPCSHKWDDLGEPPLAEQIVPLDPSRAYRLFMDRFLELVDGPIPDPPKPPTQPLLAIE